MREFDVAVQTIAYGNIRVQADSKEEAIELVNEKAEAGELADVEWMDTDTQAIDASDVS